MPPFGVDLDLPLWVELSLSRVVEAVVRPRVCPQPQLCGRSGAASGHRRSRPASGRSRPKPPLDLRTWPAAVSLKLLVAWRSARVANGRSRKPTATRDDSRLQLDPRSPCCSRAAPAAAATSSHHGMARAGQGWYPIARTSAQSCWRRRDGVLDHWPRRRGVHHGRSRSACRAQTS